MPRDPFDLPDYPITVGKRYRLRADAGREWPRVVEVDAIDGGRIKFHNVEDEWTIFTESVGDFRDAYDPD